MSTSTRSNKTSQSNCATESPHGVGAITTTVTVTLNHWLTTTFTPSVVSAPTASTECASPSAFSQVQLTSSPANINVIIGVSGGLGGAVFLVTATLILFCWWRKRRQAAFQRGAEKSFRTSDVSFTSTSVRKDNADIRQLLNAALESRSSLVMPRPTTPILLQAVPAPEDPTLAKGNSAVPAFASLQPQLAKANFPPPPRSPHRATSRRRTRSASATRSQFASPALLETPRMPPPVQTPGSQAREH